MAAPNPNAPEVLRGEILEEARSQKEEILKVARQEAEGLLAKARAESDEFRVERQRAAQLEATRRREAILATVPVEAGRLRSARVEALLAAIHERVCAQLQAHDGFDYRKTIIRLASEALSQMAATAFVMKLSAADHRALGDGLTEAVRRAVKGTAPAISISNDTAFRNGEVIIQDVEGRQSWNIGLRARLARLWPELRRRIAAQTSLVSESGSAGGGA